MMARTCSYVYSDNLGACRNAKNKVKVYFVHRCLVWKMGFSVNLLILYLRSLFLGFEERTLLQSSTVCIGSCAAPRLYDIYLATMDEKIQASLDTQAFLNVVDCVDDYLLLFKTVVLK